MQAFQAARLWLQVVGGAVAALAIVWLLAQSIFHLRLLNVQTGSMRPAFGPGDALVMRQMSGELPRPGTIVSYHSARNPNELVTHRVVRVDVNKGSFQTKGDALTQADPLVHSTLLAGHVVAIMPGLGRLLTWLQTWPGLVLCVYIPAAAIVVSEVYRLEKIRAVARIYRLYKAQVV